MSSEKPKEVKKKLEQNEGKAKIIIEKTQLGQILETHQKIKERKKKVERQKEEFRDILHSAYWVMLEEKKETTIKEPFVLKERELINTAHPRVAQICAMANGREHDKKEEELKKKCQDEYKNIVGDILDKVGDLRVYMGTFFSAAGFSHISRKLYNDDNMVYIIGKDMIKIRPPISKQNSRSIEKLDLKTQDGEEVEEILSYADDIEQLQIKTLDDLEQFSRQMKKLKQYILNNLQTQITAATI